MPRSFWSEPNASQLTVTLPSLVSFTLTKTSGTPYTVDLQTLSPATLAICIARGLKERVTDSMAGEAPADPRACADDAIAALATYGWTSTRGPAGGPTGSDAHFARWLRGEAHRALRQAGRLGAKKTHQEANNRLIAALAASPAFAARMRVLYDATLTAQTAMSEDAAILDVATLSA